MYTINFTLQTSQEKNTFFPYEGIGQDKQGNRESPKNLASVSFSWNKYNRR